MKYYLSVLSILTTSFLIAGCAVKLEDFQEMSAAQRADRVCNGASYGGRFTGQINEVRTSITNLDAMARETALRIDRGYWEEKKCTQIPVPPDQQCVDVGDGLELCESSEAKTVQHCETIRHTVDKEREINSLAVHNKKLSDARQKLDELESDRQIEYDKCHSQVIKMNAEQAFDLYQ